MSNHETVILTVYVSAGVVLLALLASLALTVWIGRLVDRHTAAYSENDRQVRSPEYLQGWHMIDMLRHIRSICLWVVAMPFIAIGATLVLSLLSRWQPGELFLGTGAATLALAFFYCRSLAYSAWDKWLKHKNP